MVFEIIRSHFLFVLLFIIVVGFILLILIIYKKGFAKKHKSLIRVIIFLMSFVLIYGSYFQWNRRPKGKFAWKVDNFNKNFNNLFQKYPNYRIQNYKDLHMDYFENTVSINKNNIITYTDIENYKQNITNAYSKIALEEDFYDESYKGKQKAIDIFNAQKNKFSFYVSQNRNMLSEEDCWNGYEIGLEVIKIENTSENVFQTAVLAEDAQVKAFDSKQPDHIYEYGVGAIKCFELFLNFDKKNIGNNIEINKNEIIFRIGKIFYRISRSNVSPDLIIHCSLYAYCCFQYVIEHTDMDDPQYLLYLYYNGLAYLEVSNYIDDSALKKEISTEQLSYWNNLSNYNENYLNDYVVEDCTESRIKQVKELLIEQTDYP